MEIQDFYQLHQLLFPYLQYRQYRKKTRVVYADGTVCFKKQRSGARNGRISSTAALSCAIRYFAGGSVYDISVCHGVSVRSVYNCISRVVRAVNQCTHDKLAIEIPRDHTIQRQMAEGFRLKSEAGFDCCLGAIDGFLVWIEQPSQREAQDVAQCSGPMKFMCGRKHKYGMNMMGTVDYLGRFIDVEICHPGSTSDYLAFETSDLKWEILEKPGYLAPGLVLFGDNAYSNSSYLVTPFSGNAGKLVDRDAFNFFHSQLRIQVECTFGMMVHRWGILRRPICRTIGIVGACDMVMALCHLHNFCINSRLDTNLPPLLLSDEANVHSMGYGVNMDNFHVDSRFGSGQVDASISGIQRPTGLLDGGHHNDDYDIEMRYNDQRNVRRNQRRKRKRKKDDSPDARLPQEILLCSVINQGLNRPTPAKWKDEQVVDE